MQKDAMSLRHIQLIRSFFITIGAWPTECFEGRSYRKINSFFIIIISCINITGELNHLSRHIRVLSFIDLGELYLILFLSIMTLILAIFPPLNQYGIIVKEFVTEFHLVNFKHKGKHYEKIFSKINKFSHYFTLLMLIYTIIGPLCFNLVPLFNNYINGAFNNNVDENYTIQFSIYFRHPGYIQDEHIMITSCINLYLSYFCALLVCGIDLLMSLMAFQIIGHIRTLILDLQQIPKPKRSTLVDIFYDKNNSQANLSIEMYDAEENTFLHGRIVDFVKHHRYITSFAESVSNFFGPLLAMTYLYHLLSCALLLLACSQGELGAITRYGPLTAIVFYQLIQISVTFEVIGTESEKLEHELYDIPWECMSVSNQKLVLIFLNRIQTPIRVTALGMVEIGVQAMTGILKTTFSYFTFLRSMGK